MPKLFTARITIDDEVRSTEVANATFTPTTESSSVTDVTGKEWPLSGESSWVLQLDVFQDYSASAFARACFDREGEDVEVILDDGTTTYTSTITLVAGSIGGTTKQVAQSSISFPATKPVLGVSTGAGTESFAAKIPSVTTTATAKTKA